MRLFLAIVTLLSGLSAPTQELVDASDISRIAALIAEDDPRARVETDNAGRLHVAAQRDDWTYDVQFYGCGGNRKCRVMP